MRSSLRNQLRAPGIRLGSLGRALVLFGLLFAYGTQAFEQTQHLHVSGDLPHFAAGCVACAFGSLPGEPIAMIEEPLPPEILRADRGILAWRKPPPASLEPLDVSFSTSPPSS